MPATLQHQAPPRILELEVTAFCQLACTHCLTSSSPRASRATLPLGTWVDVVDQAAALGVATIQLIGGEPLTSPHTAPLLTHALDRGLRVEVFSNLHTVTTAMWIRLGRPGVSLAASYYSDDPAEHDRVTTVPGSHARTRANIRRALARGVPIRAGIIEVLDGQRVEAAAEDLRSLGVADILIDRMRPVGRAAPGGADPDPADLCGRCGIDKAAVLPDGTLALCVLGRSLTAGNVTGASLADLLAGPAWTAAMSRVPRAAKDPCTPATSDGNDCTPASTTACSPAFSKPAPVPPQPR